MRRLSLGLCTAFALAAFPVAAQAQVAMDRGGSVFDDAGHRVAAPGFRCGGGFFDDGFRRDGDHRRDHDGDRRHRGSPRGGDCVSSWTWVDGQWALYNNRGGASDSFNDWWHDRPDRAYPRWVTHNQNCERVWWSGGGWRC